MIGTQQYGRMENTSMNASLMRRLLVETQCTLREADSTLCEWKAAHHASRVEDLAGEASEAGWDKVLVQAGLHGVP